MPKPCNRRDFLFGTPEPHKPNHSDTSYGSGMGVVSLGEFPLKQCFGRTQCVGNICIYLERERVFIYIPWDFHRLLLIYVYIFSAPHVNTLSTQQLFHLIRKNSSLDIFHPVELPIVKRLSNITGIAKQLRLDVVKRLKFNFISLSNNQCMVYFTYIYHKKISQMWGKYTLHG